MYTCFVKSPVIILSILIGVMCLASEKGSCKINDLINLTLQADSSRFILTEQSWHLGASGTSLLSSALNVRAELHIRH